MKFLKEICKMCFDDGHQDQVVKYIQEIQEIAWKYGIVMCKCDHKKQKTFWLEELRKSDRFDCSGVIGFSFDDGVPEECDYYLEMIMNEQ